MGDPVKRFKIQDSNFKRWVGVLMVLGLSAGGWLWTMARPRPDPVWEQIQASGVFTVATDASYPPFSAVNVEGELFGFEIDLAEAIARRWGVRVEFEAIAYDALLGAVMAGRDDAVISAFVPQPARTKDIAFTRSYFVGGTVLVVPSNYQLPITNNVLEWSSGKTIAVEFGSGGDALARQWARRMGGLTRWPMPTAAEALLAVESGDADAALVDVVSAYDFLLSHPTLTLAGPPLEPEPYTIAVSAHSPILFRELENALQAMEADGTLPGLRVKWFGEAAKNNE